MTSTVVIQIGNTDDKLTQFDWSRFVSAVQDVLTRWRFMIHFHGCSVGSAPWQNACWVTEADENWVDTLQEELALIARNFNQESIALTVGQTEFVLARGW